MRCDHQQGGQQLAAGTGVERDRAAAQAARVDLQREKSLLAAAADVGAQGAQRFDQAAHRPLPHLGHAILSCPALG
jgi:hypothetical protein